jgi:hypothetical protein
MLQRKILQYIVLLMALFLIISSCTAEDELNEELEPLLESGNEITEGELQSIKDYIAAHKQDFLKDLPQLFKNGELDNPKLLEWIKNSESYIDLTTLDGKTIKLPDSNTESNANTATIFPKLYLERSGSMTSYDASDGKGEFKDVLTSMLNNFSAVNNQKSIIYVVNDSVYNSKLTFKQLVESPNIFDATKNIGDASYTDFELIFKTILKDLKPGEISVLFSDLIYSTPSMQNQSYARILSAAQALTQNVFQSQSNKVSVLVLKFNSGYNGKYYPHNSKSIQYLGQRPYYVCLLADNATMKDFLKNDNYANIRKWNSYKNYENFHFFSSDNAQKTPYFTIALDDVEKQGEYAQETNELTSGKKYVHTLEVIDHDVDGKLTISVLVDLASFQIPESSKVDTAFYSIESGQAFKISKIERVSGITNVTHKIVITTNKKRGGDSKVIIGLKKVFPPKWVKDSNSDNDSNTKATNFATTTFGFKSLMTGLDKAYDPNSTSHQFKITINLQN